MSKIKPLQAFASAKSVGFSGIGSQTPLSLDGAADMCNFRISADGTLRTRSGYRKLFSFGSADERIRGIWEGVYSGNRICFVVAGQTVYLFDATAKSAQSVGTVSDAERDVFFFCYSDEIYLFDGETIQIYRKVSKKFEVNVPYVPLHGQDWHPTKFGDVYEEPNLLTPHLRIHYYNSTGTKTFYFPYFPSAVDGVRADGVATTDYEFDEGSDFLTLTTSSVPTYVEIAITLDMHDEVRERIRSSLYAYVHSQSKEGKETVLLYGGENDPSLYCTKPITAVQLNHCMLFYRKADKLYIRSKDILTPGDRDHPLTSLCPVYDSLLAFDGIQAHLLTFEENGTISSTRIPSYGSVFKGICPTIAGKPVLLNKSGVFLLSPSASRPETPEVKKISDLVDGYFSSEIKASAIGRFDLENGELWVCSPEEENGSVLVWNTQRKEWYRFDHIGASAFFEHSYGKGFARGNSLYVLEDSLFTDDDEEIHAYYQSNYFDMGASETPRRALRISVCANPHGNEATLEMTTERGTKTRSLPQRSAGEAPSNYDFRFGIRRHRFLRFCIRTQGRAQSEILKIAFYANL